MSATQEDLLYFEREAKMKGYMRIAGVDEAGRGPLAGPVVAAACILPDRAFLQEVTTLDSKALSRQKRRALFEEILNAEDVHFGIGIVNAQTIDAINILQATMKAMLKAIAALDEEPDFLLIDGNKAPHCEIESIAIVKGDGRSLSIGAASILAKETRDRIMEEADQKWPHYGFASHMGYGTKAHRQAIEEYGACSIHRMSFAPLKHIGVKK